MRIRLMRSFHTDAVVCVAISGTPRKSSQSAAAVEPKIVVEVSRVSCTTQQEQNFYVASDDKKKKMVEFIVEAAGNYDDILDERIVVDFINEFNVDDAFARQAILYTCAFDGATQASAIILSSDTEGDSDSDDRTAGATKKQSTAVKIKIEKDRTSNTKPVDAQVDSLLIPSCLSLIHI